MYGHATTPNLPIVVPDQQAVPETRGDALPTSAPGEPKVTANQASAHGTTEEPKDATHQDGYGELARLLATQGLVHAGQCSMQSDAKHNSDPLRHDPDQLQGDTGLVEGG